MEEEPAEPAESTEPTTSAKSAGPTEPAKFPRPDESAKPVGAAETTEPVEPAESTEEGGSEGSGAPWKLCFIITMVALVALAGVAIAMPAIMNRLDGRSTNGQMNANSS